MTTPTLTRDSPGDTPIVSDGACPSAIRVALVEDDLAFQALLANNLRAADGLCLHALASTRAQALQMLSGEPADVLLVDLGLPDGSGLDVIRAATIAWPQCAIMVSTVFGDELHVIRSIECGATGYLLKDESAVNMATEIRHLHKGGSPISPIIARQMLLRFKAPASVAPAAALGVQRRELSANEQRTLELITKGFTVEEIAVLMGIARSTVQTYVRRVYQKLNVTSRTEAVFEARILGLVPP